jgi:(p)ppGpp synthase/HD superfamily hydrolase
MTPDSSNNALVLLSRAADFAARRHVAQRRKGDAAEPYINHLTEVATLLAEATDGADPVLVAGGLLHDTLEDTDTTYEDLVESFGPEVAALVAEVTDDKSLAKEERKRLQIEKTPGKSRRAKLLKLADKTSNLRSLVSSPPGGWTDERLRDYVGWAEAVVRSCRGLNQKLEAGVDAALAEAKRRFGA